MSTQDLEAKIVVLGSSGVGKTSLLTRFVQNTFLPPSVSIPTVGATFTTKRLESPDTNPPTVIRLQIWDTAGQERFRSISKLYYRGANAALLCYDITNETSFLDMGTWMEELKRNCGSDCIIHVVGTKADIVAEDPKARKVPFERCIQYVSEQLHDANLQPGQLSGSMPNSAFRRGSIGTDLSCQSPTVPGSRNSIMWDNDFVWDSCHEISAKDGDGVDEIFRVVTRKLVEQRAAQESVLRGQADGSSTPGSSEDGIDPLEGKGRFDKKGAFKLSIGDKRRSWLVFPNSGANSPDGSGPNSPGGHGSQGRCC